MKRFIFTMGITHIIYGSLSLLYLGFFLILLSVPQSPEQNPALHIINGSLSLQIWYIGMSCIDFIMALLIIISGAGLLMMANWGKIITIGFVMYNILSTFIRSFVSFIFLILPLWQEVINRATDEIVGGATIITFLTIGSFLLNIGYSSLTTIVITSPDTAKLFRK